MNAITAACVEALRQSAYFGLGVFLRKTDAFSHLDGAAVSRLMLTLVVPVLLVGLNVNSASFLADKATRALVLLNVGHFVFLWLTSWLAFRNLPVKDRGIATVLVTCLSCCFSGVLCHGMREGLLSRTRLAIVSDLPVTILSFAIAGFILTRTRRRMQGGTMPGKYKHVDGGVYSGEWKGFVKHGFGVYTYPSGSIYSGEWKENVKEGFGTYRYAVGGAYIGGWKNGNPSGMGIRVYKSGKSAHGNFAEGKLVDKLQAEVCEATIDRGLRAAKHASSIAKERNQSVYQKVFTELLELSPIAFVLLVHRLPGAFSALVSEETVKVILLFFAPLAALAYGLQSVFGPSVSDSTLLDVKGMLSFRYAMSCLFASLVLAVAPSTALLMPIDRTIALSCILCPVSPLLILLTQKYTREAKDFIRAVVGWSMVSSLALTTLAQVLCEANKGYTASAFTFVTSLVLLSAYFRNARGITQPSSSKVSTAMSSTAVFATPGGQRRQRNSLPTKNQKVLHSLHKVKRHGGRCSRQAYRPCLRRVETARPCFTNNASRAISIV
jgi:hypothetical protein